jgi:hypothetical protein
MRAPKGPQGDLAVIYGFAKAMDPGSVVREGEMDMANSTASIVDQMKVKYKSFAEGKGLPPEVRTGLIEAARAKTLGMRDGYTHRYQQYREQAHQMGIPAHQVVGNFLADSVRPVEEQYIQQHGGTPRNQQGNQAAPSFDVAAPGSKFRTENNPERSAFIDQMVRQGVPFDQAQQQYGQRFPGAPVFDNPAKWEQALDFARKHPEAAGSFGQSMDTVPMDQTEQDRNWLGQTAPGQAATLFGNALTGGIPSALAGEEGQMAVGNAREGLGGWSLAPEAAGAIGATLAGTRALGAIPALASRPGAAMLGADAAYGGLYGGTQNPDNPVGGAVLGAGAGVLGNQIGSRVLAPGLRAGGAAIGINPAPKLPRGQDLIATQTNKADPSAVMGQLQSAADLNMPFALVDAAPQLRALGGSVTRKSPDAFALANERLGSRVMGQAERALGQIDRHLTPAGDINAIKNAEMQAARAAAAPLYESSYATVVPQTPQLTALLNTPAGRGALARARTIAANEGRDPMSMGFALDDNGDVILRPVNMGALERQGSARNAVRDAQNAYRRAKAAKGGDVDKAYSDLLRAREEQRAADAALASAPSPETAQTNPTYSTQTLDYVKRGLDDTLEQYRDPVTRELRLDEAGRAIQGVRQSMLQEVDRLNPDYAAARSAYQNRASRATDADRGYKATGPRVLPETVAGVANGLSPENLTSYRQGFTSSLADTIENTRLSANPYERVFGSPAQQSKMNTLFPEGAPRFAQARAVEGQMSQTNKELFGGSPTASRMEADKLFEGGALEGAMDLGLSVASGTPPINAMRAGLFAGRSGFSGLKDAYNLGIGKSAQQRALEMAPSLFNPDPHATMAALEELMKRKAARDAYVQRTGMFGAGIGAPLAVTAYGN